jgi:serine/threonine protein phosphatase PrpC
MSAPGAAPTGLDVAALSDVGTAREHNEDCCGSVVESGACAVVAVADGVSSYAGGEVASQMAIESLLRAFGEAPRELGAGGRLYRAVQQANIEIYDRAIAVPELLGMATTLTAAAIDGGALTAVHVGDSRLYLLRDGVITQLSKDHTAVADKVRFGLLTREQARTHPDRCILTRSMGRELIVSRDRITQWLEEGDVLVLCSDGLHNVLADAELARLAAQGDAAGACRALVDAANARGTPDNVTAAVVRVTAPPTRTAPARGLGTTLRRLLGGRGPWTT